MTGERAKEENARPGEAVGAGETEDQRGGDGGATEDAVPGDLEREPMTEKELREEIRALGTKWKRALADLENYRKRMERERRRRVAEAREELLLSMVEIADDFERALASSKDSDLPRDDPFRQGVELILKRVKDVLAKNGVRPIETEGATFDPLIHEAVAHVESEGHGSDEIIEEVTKGYTVDDRPLRCARVVVAK